MPASGEGFGDTHESTYNNPTNLEALGRAADGRGELSGEGFGENQAGFVRPQGESRPISDEAPDNIIPETTEVTSELLDESSK